MSMAHCNAAETVCLRGWLGLAGYCPLGAFYRFNNYDYMKLRSTSTARIPRARHGAPFCPPARLLLRQHDL